MDGSLAFQRQRPSRLSSNQPNVALERQLCIYPAPSKPGLPSGGPYNPRQRQDVNGPSAAVQKILGTGRDRGACRIDVIDQKNVASGHLLAPRTFHFEGVGHLCATRTPPQPALTRA